MSKFMPIYKKIAADFQEAIANEKYPLGSKLPTEHELMAKLDVSRATVIAALDHLQHLGLVYRRPRAGTLVVSRFPMRSEIEATVLTDWTQYGVEYTFHVDDMLRATLPERAGLTEEESANWLLLHGRRTSRATGEALCVIDLYVNPAFASIESKITAQPPRIYSLIEADFGPQVRVVEQELGVTRMDESHAARIGVEPETVSVEVIRWFRGAKGKLIEFTWDQHPGNRFKHRTKTYRGSLEG